MTKPITNVLDCNFLSAGDSCAVEVCVGWGGVEGCEGAFAFEHHADNFKDWGSEGKGRPKHRRDLNSIPSADKTSDLSFDNRPPPASSVTSLYNFIRF